MRLSSVRIGVPVNSVLTFGKNCAHSLNPSKTARTMRAVMRLARCREWHSIRE